MGQTMSEFLAFNKAKIQSLPEEARDAVLDLVFERGLEQKLKGSNLTPDELVEAKNLFKSRYLGTPAPRLSSTFGAREAEARPEDVGSSLPAKAFGSIAAGLMQGTANLTSAAGLVPNPVSKHFAETADVYRNKTFEREHPVIEGALEIGGQTPLFMTAGEGARGIGKASVSTAALGIRGATKITQALKNAVPFLSNLAADSLIYSKTPEELASPVNLGVAAIGAGVAGREGAKAFSRAAAPSISRPLAGAGKAVEAATDVKLGTPSVAAEASKSFEPHSMPVESTTPSTPLSMKPVNEYILEVNKMPGTPAEKIQKIQDYLAASAKVEESEAALAKTPETKVLESEIKKEVAKVAPKKFDMAKAKAKFAGTSELGESLTKSGSLPGRIAPKSGSIEEMAMKLGEADEKTMESLGKRNKIPKKGKVPKEGL